VELRFLDYYNRELRYLRELGGEFARDFPKIAARLGLDSFECADPYVERLLEGFAFLAARVHLKIDSEFPRFTESLLNMVCPHYLGPTPSMTVVQLVPDQQQGGLSDGFVVPRGTPLKCKVHADEPAVCEFRTGQDVALWPIELVGLRLSPVTGSPEVDFGTGARIQGTLTLHLRTTTSIPFSRLALNELTLFFRGMDPVGLGLFELFAAAAVGVATRVPGQDWMRLADARAGPVGLEDSEALLPVGARSFQGYRLLHEYFAFPQRFLFARIEGLARGVRGCAGTEMELMLGLSRYTASLESAATASAVALFCAPAVNLFPRTADRIQLSDRDHEYNVVADRAHPMDFEVHSVLGASGFGAKGDRRRIFTPFYRVEGRAPDLADSAFFTIRRTLRQPSQRQRVRGSRAGYLGSEVFISLVDGREGPFRSSLRQLSVDTLCTNRDLPLIMPVGSRATDFDVAPGLPLESIRCLAGPSAPRPSQAVGETSWRLIGHLSLNYLTLVGSGNEGASSLRELLSLYADLSDEVGRRQIAGVSASTAQAIVRRLPFDGPPTFGRGTEFVVDCDEAAFEGTSVFLMGLILSRFLARYVSINSFVETVVRTRQRGEIARWPMSIGRRPTI
jgi:type VI secretion system protein ImpG